MRVAVVGAGYFAQFQIAAWHRMAGIELAAVADRDP
ncbi:MAG: Gfo/Idh/MocA family oxidoreductase, partial [Pseudomonadota bacterium]